MMVWMERNERGKILKEFENVKKSVRMMSLDVEEEDMMVVDMSKEEEERVRRQIDGSGAF